MSRNGNLSAVTLVFQSVEQAVFNNRLQNKIRHLNFSQIGVDIAFIIKLGVAVAHQLHISIKQLGFIVKRNHGVVDLDAVPEKFNELHKQIGNLFIAVKLSLNSDGIQRVIKEMRIYLTFQVEH